MPYVLRVMLNLVVVARILAFNTIALGCIIFTVSKLVFPKGMTNRLVDISHKTNGFNYLNRHFHIKHQCLFQLHIFH